MRRMFGGKFNGRRPVLAPVGDCVKLECIGFAGGQSHAELAGNIVPNIYICGGVVNRLILVCNASAVAVVQSDTALGCIYCLAEIHFAGEMRIRLGDCRCGRAFPGSLRRCSNKVGSDKAGRSTGVSRGKSLCRCILPGIGFNCRYLIGIYNSGNDSDMTICCIGFISAVLQYCTGTPNNDISRLRVAVNSAPTGRKCVPCIVTRITAGAIDTEIIIICKNQVNTLTAICVIHIPAPAFIGTSPGPGNSFCLRMCNICICF